MIPVKRLLLLFSSCVAIAAAQTPAPAPAPKAAANAPVSVTIGDKELKIPRPAEGFERCDGINETVDKSLSGFLPASNRMLAYFCTNADAEALRGGKAADMKSNFNLQTLRPLETQEVGTKTFASVRGEMRKGVEGMKTKLDAEVQKLVEKGNTNITEQTKLDSALSVSNAAVLGFFDEANPNVLGFTMAVKVGGKIAGEEANLRSVVSTYMIPANGRLLLLYATRPFTKDADRQAVERSVKAWGDAIIAANPKIEGKAAK